MTDGQLKEVKERESKATPGSWKYDGYGEQVRTDDDQFKIADIRGIGAGLPIDDNGQFIAHARTDIPLLIAEVERLQAKLTVIEDKVDGMNWNSMGEDL